MLHLAVAIVIVDHEVVQFLWQWQLLVFVCVCLCVFEVVARVVGKGEGGGRVRDGNAWETLVNVIKVHGWSFLIHRHRTWSFDDKHQNAQIFNFLSFSWYHSAMALYESNPIPTSFFNSWHHCVGYAIRLPEQFEAKEKMKEIGYFPAPRIFVVVFGTAISTSLYILEVCLIPFYIL